ncbi:hypothetical protein LDVICp162 [lymphocystis disease virus-China]|uniref:Uncharacterized protein n=1 Tax=lymphocystis disease virus-China TaxID=256729 RepID=Q677V0_9VIRU|nr:hypothetical protein LDVICp162 [lymphocystis disease virus-China]AAU11007.1 hypothetical protein [lymphocystis disease virus-China]
MIKSKSGQIISRCFIGLQRFFPQMINRFKGSVSKGNIFRSPFHLEKIKLLITSYKPLIIDVKNVNDCTFCQRKKFTFK